MVECEPNHLTLRKEVGLIVGIIKVYNTAFIRWTTHSPPGLSAKDVLMARFCDEKAEECGELAVEAGKEDGGVGKELADRVATEGGDCCVPKKKTG